MTGPGIRLETGHVLEERYLLEKVIGQGGMGTVFAARHLELDERVAVKVLQSDSSFVTVEDEHLERFIREARLAAKIKNEHVVRILDVARGKNGAPPYIVMELLDGCDLGELSNARGRLPVPEAIGYVLQACEALAEAHVLGIVHRDLKSSNLHVSQRSDGAPLVKVLDFGICKMHDDAASSSDMNLNLTSTESVFGSPAYMSPEQIRSAKYVDARTDVWALAVVLYELVTAELPFAGRNQADMLASILNGPYIPVRKYAPDVPDGFELVMRAAFVKDRDARTPSIAAFAAALAPFVDAAGAASLATIQRIAARPRGVDTSGLRSAPPPAMPPAAGTDDTMRALPPMMAVPPMEAPVSRTDRVMSVPPLEKNERGRTLPLVVMAAVAGVALAVTLGVFLVMTKREVPATQPPEAPPLPPVSVAAPSVQAPSPSPSSAPSATEDAIVTSTPSAVARPKPRPASPKPNAPPPIDTNSRQ